MLAGQLFDPTDRAIEEARSRAAELCYQLNNLAPNETKKRLETTRTLFRSAGSGVIVRSPFVCDFGCNIDIGDNVFINSNCVILDVCRIALGSNSWIGPGVHIYAGDHPLDWQKRRQRQLGRAIDIGKDCWLGGGVLVLPGVTIGERSVIGAGSVVTRNIPPNVIAFGNPCRVRRSVPSDE